MALSLSGSLIGQSNACGSKSRGRFARREWLIGLLGLITCSLSSGCLSTGKWWKSEDATYDHPCNMVIHWHKGVGYAPDANQNGKPSPGFAGRLYLFGADISAPLPANGTLVVTLYDPNSKGPDGKGMKPIQDWHLPPGLLLRLRKSDVFGEGHTLFLPWATYHPSVAEVVLRAKFTPVGAQVPLFYDSGIIRLGGMQVLEAPKLRKNTRSAAEQRKAMAEAERQIAEQQRSLANGDLASRIAEIRKRNGAGPLPDAGRGTAPLRSPAPGVESLRMPSRAPKNPGGTPQGRSSRVTIYPQLPTR